MSAPTTGAKPLPPTWIAALRAIEANDYNPMGRAGSGVEVSVGRALLRRGLVERAGARMPLTPAGRAMLASLDSAAHVNAIVARLEALGYEGVRAVTRKPASPLDAIEVRGQLFTLRAVMVGDNTAEATYRIVAALSGEDAVALAVRGALPLFEVSFAATDDVDEDDFGRQTASRFSRVWPAVSAERARAEATAWGESDGCAVVTDVEGVLP